MLMPMTKFSKALERDTKHNKTFCIYTYCQKEVLSISKEHLRVLSWKFLGMMNSCWRVTSTSCPFYMLPPILTNQNVEKAMLFKTVKRSSNYASRDPKHTPQKPLGQG